jgi:RHS repeat-associated protein
MTLAINKMSMKKLVIKTALSGAVSSYFFRIVFIVATGCAMVLSKTSLAQTVQISGQYPAFNSTTYTYTYQATTTGGSFSVTGGTLNSSTFVSGACGGGGGSLAAMARVQTAASGGGGSTYCYSAVVTWGTGASGTISFKMNGVVVTTLNVSLCPQTTPAPTAAFSSNSCGNAQISYTGAPPANVTWYWQTSSTGTDMTNSSNTYNVSASGNYYLRGYSVCGQWGAAVAVNGNGGYVPVYPIPSAPSSAAGASFCGPNSTTISAVPGANGNTIRWYSAASGGSPIYTGTSYPTPTLSSTTTYYVSTYNSTSGCEYNGARLAVTVTVNAVPNVSVSPTTVTLCSGSATTLTVTNPNGVSGTTLSWSAQTNNATVPATSGTGNISGTFSNTDHVNQGSVTYTITPSTSTCTGTPITATVTINNTPAVPSVTNATICHYGTGTISASLGAGGNGVNWYMASSGGSPFYQGLSQTLTDESGTLATTTYYVSSINTTTGCESARVAVTLTVNSAVIPSSPMAVVNGSVCGGGLVNLSASPGTNGDGIVWYNLTSPIATGTNYSPTVSTTTTYYAYSSSSTTGCLSRYATPVTATVNAIPTAAVSPASVTLCSGSATSFTVTNPNTVSGTTLTWTTAASNASLPAATGSGNIAGTFSNQDNVNPGTVVYTITPATAACTGATVTATVNILNTPATPTPGTFITYDANTPVTVQIPVPSGQQATWYPSTGSPVTGPTYQYTLGTVTPDNSNWVSVSLKEVTTQCETPHVAVPVILVTNISLSSVTKELVRVTGKQRNPDVDNLSAAEKVKSVTYFDGLGRGVQSIAINTTPSGQDLVLPVEYDNLGRASKSYLPYAANTATANAPNGTFQSNYATQQANFYGPSSPANDKIVNDSYPFATGRYEASPLGRVLEQGSPGNNGQLGSHTKQVAYSLNTGATGDDAEEVRKILADGTNAGYYSVGQLSKVTGTDENGNIVVTFTNGIGKTVALKQKRDAATWLQTYYIYDDFNRLKYIMPPAGFAAWKTGGWSQSLLDTYCHQFVYDNRDRLTQKKTPGQAWSYYAYDNLNRLILSQDGNQRQLGKWTFTKYDLLGRTVMTGLYVNSTLTTQALAQTAVNNFYVSPATIYYEKPSTAAGNLWGYTVVSYPTEVANMDVWNVTYYDNYNFTMNDGSAPAYDNTHLAGMEAQASAYTRGRVTGSRKQVVGASIWIVSAVFYDNYGRVIQTQANNHLKLAAFDKSSTVYDFEKVTATKLSTGPNVNSTTHIVQTPVYDAQGRLYQIKHNINGLGDQIVAQYEYNELGQMVDKKLHYNGSTFLQSVDYRYDIKGRLTSINNAQLANDANATNDDSNDFFGMELLYDAVESSSLGNTPMYNGNLSAIKWKNAGVAAGATDQRSYKYTYDGASQLTAANFNAYSGSAWTKESGTLDETITSYDLNGNIVNLNRFQNNRGLSGATVTSTAQAIDQLTYTYAAGNQLSKVADASANTGGFNDGTNQTTEYTYDSHGNVKSDLNKGISSIGYNALGKPTLITFSNGTTMAYTYDASGNKVKTISTVGGVSTTTHYVAGFVYSSNAPTFFSSPEGRVVMNGSTFEYQYAITDNQGNTRVLFSSMTPAPVVLTATFEGDANDNSSSFTDVNHVVAMAAANTSTVPAGANKVEAMNQDYPVGPSKSIKVYAGDRVDAEVYVYYEASSGWGATDQPLTALITSIAGAFGGVSGGTGEPGSIYNGVSSSLTNIGHGPNQTDNAPSAFLNYIYFDKNYKVKESNWVKVPTSAWFSKQKIALPTINATEAGYVFIYLSFEDLSNNLVYFDDLKITYTPTNIVQSNEYYPFGMQTANSWTRDNTTNKFLYDAGSELNSTTGLYDLPFRNYDATLGRFFQVDALATTSHNVTPYHYAGNNPVAANDPSGLVKQYWDYSSWGAAPWDIKLNTMAGANADAVDRYSRVEAMSWSLDGGGGGGGHFSVIISGEGNVTLTGAAAQNALRALIAGGGVVIDANDKGATAAYFVNTGDTNINGFWTPGDGFISQSMIVAINGYAERKANSMLIASNSKHWIDDGMQAKPEIRVGITFGGIENTDQAFKHYYTGKGASAFIGNGVIQDLIESDGFQSRHERIISGLTTLMRGNFGVDLTMKDVFIGDTNVDYSISCLGNSCTVTYSLFARDGFWDVDFLDETWGKAIPIGRWQADGIGPNLERFGGRPYPFIPVTATSTFANPGYK